MRLVVVAPGAARRSRPALVAAAAQVAAPQGAAQVVAAGMQRA
jgi:hypothetical protein